MKKIVKKIIVIGSFNLLGYAMLMNGLASLPMLTAQMGINTVLAQNIVGMLEAGMTVWGIIGLIGTLNVVGAGALFAAKSMLKSMGRTAVIGW